MNATTTTELPTPPALASVIGSERLEEMVRRLWDDD